VLQVSSLVYVDGKLAPTVVTDSFDDGSTVLSVTGDFCAKFGSIELVCGEVDKNILND
jgi:hypothetical protein